MSRAPLRSDLADAVDRAGHLLGCGRDLQRIEALTDGLEVLGVVAVRHEGRCGVLALAEDRLIFVCRGWFTRIEDEILLGRVATVQWRTFLGSGTVKVHTTGGTVLEFTGAAPGPGLELVNAVRRFHEDEARELADVRTGVLDMAEAWRKVMDEPAAPVSAVEPDPAPAGPSARPGSRNRHHELAVV